MSKKRNVIIIFISIAIIALYLNGCENNKDADIAETVKINFNYLGRDVEINEKTEINNIKHIISQMEKQPVEEDADDGRINGYFTLASGTQVPFKTTGSNIIIGNFKYHAQGAENMLRNIFSKYIYDIGFIIDKLNESKIIKLTAKDTGDTYTLNDSEKSALIGLLSNFKPIEVGSGIFIEYPFYEINIETGNNSAVIINITADGSIYIKDNLFSSHYGSTDNLWKYVSALLPVKQSKDESNILYLFNSSKVTVNNTVYMGEYVHRVANIVRCLVEEIDKVEEVGTGYAETSKKIELVFTIGNEAYSVDVYKNYFIYSSKIYSSPDIYNKIISALSVG